MKNHILKTIGPVLAIMFMLCTFASAATVDKQDEGELQDTYFKSFWVADNVAFPSERKIYIRKVEAGFSSTWLSKFKSETTPAYRELIKKNYGQQLHIQLTEQFENAGWNVVSAPEENILTMQATLENIFIVAPQINTSKTTLVAYIGSSDLKVELLGSDAKAILKIEDGRIVDGVGNAFIETNRALNYSRFRKLMAHWASVVTPYVDLLADIAEVQKTS